MLPYEPLPGVRLPLVPPPYVLPPYVVWLDVACEVAVEFALEPESKRCHAPPDSLLVAPCEPD